jgi:hypothetical protein
MSVSRRHVLQEFRKESFSRLIYDYFRSAKIHGNAADDLILGKSTFAQPAGRN